MVQKFLAESPVPLGATILPDGKVRFAVAVPWYVEAAFVALYAPGSGDAYPDRVVELTSSVHSPWSEYNGRIVSVEVDGLNANWGYAYRLTPRTDCWKEGQQAFSPGDARIINPNKLVLDPYAKALFRTLRWGDSLFAIKPGAVNVMSDEWNGRDCPIGAIVPVDNFNWEGDRHPRTAWDETIIYETHVSGFTRKMPSARHPGKFSEIGSAQCIEHLKRLGITAVQLMPVFASTPNKSNQRHFWRYWTLGFFMLEPSYSCYSEPSEMIYEFQQMVKNLHSAGIEVILDVVFNHTAEGNHKGEAFSFKLLDDGAYYRKCRDAGDYHGDYFYYYDLTGCGNTLNVNNPLVLRMIMDSLRYWVEVMHVDGFRFDLASALALSEPDHQGHLHLHSELFHLIQADPVLGQSKIIVEPYSCGGHYHLGQYPNGVFEISDRWKWGSRNYWRDTARSTAAQILTGDRFKTGSLEDRGAWTICGHANHDGMTTFDLVTYHDRTNESGEPERVTIAIGPSGPTTDPVFLARRLRTARGLIAKTILNPGGVPLVLYGDELLRSQGGHNNPYSLDDETVWMNWAGPYNLVEFLRRLIDLRHRYAVFKRMFRPPVDPLDSWIKFFDELGTEFSVMDLGEHHSRFGMLLLADGIKLEGDHSHVYLAFRPGADKKRVRYNLPKLEKNGTWIRVFASSPILLSRQFKELRLSSFYCYMRSRSMAMFRFEPSGK